MQENMTIIIMALFLVISLAIGFFVSRGEDMEGFLIGNRDLGVFQSIMTLCGTFVGAMTFLVYTAFVFTYGVSAAWIFIGYWLGFILFIPFALHLKDYSDNKRFYTIIDYFNSKFGKGIALLVVAVIFIWYFGTLSAQFIGGGKVLSELTGMDYYTAAIIMCVVIVAYLILGGFKSVVATDVFQFGILGIIIIIATFSLKTGIQVPVSHFNLFNAGPVNIIAFLILGILTPFATQDYWQKIFAMRDRSVVKKSFAISGFIVLFLSFFLTYIGLVARTYYQEIDPDLAILYSFTRLIPPALVGFVAVAFFAAILSTADTFLFLLSVNFTNDFMDFKGNERGKVKATRIAIISIGVLALGLALVFPNIVDVAIIFKAIGLIVSPIVLYVWLSKGNSRAIVATLLITFCIIIGLSASGFVRPELIFVSLIGGALIYALAALIDGIFGKVTNRSKPVYR